MEFNIELTKQLGEELTDLWLECSIRCDKIEELVKQLKEQSEK